MTSASESVTITVGADDVGRVDKAIARHYPAAGRRALARLFADGAVRVGGKRAAKGDFVAAGETIALAYVPATGDALRPQPDPAALAQLELLVERAELIAIAKPAGMPSQPLRAGELGTAANAIAARWPECADACDADGAADIRDGGLVHRLDIGTSGVLIAARTPAAYRELRAAFGAGATHAITKQYLAITRGKPVSRECEAALAQRGDHVVADAADGLPAHTVFTVERSAGELALVRCEARTGRMHQVRAHLAHVGAPIVGDARYGGGELAGHDGFFLHAAQLALPDGTVIEAPLPARFVAALAACGL